MLKYFLAAGALVVAGVPAAVGLSGNASFDRDVPVRVPEQAQTVAPTPTPTRTPADDRTRSVDDDGTPDQGPGDFGTTEAESGDDHGGDRPRDERTEAGDDRDGSGGHHGDDSGDDSGEDRSGSNSGSDSSDDSDDSSGSNSGSGSSGGGSDDGSGHD